MLENKDQLTAVEVTDFQSEIFNSINEMIKLSGVDSDDNTLVLIGFALRHIDIESTIGTTDKGVNGLLVYVDESVQSEMLYRHTKGVIVACCAGALSTVRLANEQLKRYREDLRKHPGSNDNGVLH